MSDQEQHYFELIDKFLSDAMSEKERSDFLNEVSKNEALKAQLEETKIAHEAVKVAGRNELKQKFSEFENDTDEAKVVPLFSLALLGKVAAAFIIGFSVTYFVIKNSGKTEEKLFAEHFEIYKAPSATRSAAKGEDLHWVDAIKNYNEGAYQEALSSFQKTTAAPKYLVDFYMGVCYLSGESPNYDKAIEYFDAVRHGKDSDYKAASEWYRALCLMMLKKNNLAKEAFGQIVSNDSFYAERAGSILKKLD